MWTREQPKEVGWYWFKPTDCHLPEEAALPKMLFVTRDVNGSVWAEDTVNQERYSVHDIKGEWAGPLIPPEDSRR